MTIDNKPDMISESIIMTNTQGGTIMNLKRISTILLSFVVVLLVAMLLN